MKPLTNRQNVKTYQSKKTTRLANRQQKQKKNGSQVSAEIYLVGTSMDLKKDTKQLQ